MRIREVGIFSKKQNLPMTESINPKKSYRTNRDFCRVKLQRVISIPLARAEKVGVLPQLCIQREHYLLSYHNKEIHTRVRYTSTKYISTKYTSTKYISTILVYIHKH